MITAGTRFHDAIDGEGPTRRRRLRPRTLASNIWQKEIAVAEPPWRLAEKVE